MVCAGMIGYALYSCASDGRVAKWDLVTGTCSLWWDADKSPVYSLALSPDHKTIFTASHTIKQWRPSDGDNSLITTLTGHASEVLQLLPVALEKGDAVKNFYILSAAAEDRLINTWKIQRLSKMGNASEAIVSFGLPAIPSFMDILAPAQSKQPILLAVVCEKTQLHIFEHQLNGLGKAPLQSSVLLQITCPAGAAATSPRPLNIVAVRFCPAPVDHTQKQTCIIIAYGNQLQFAFEKWVYSKSEKHVFLVREDPSSVKLTVQESVSKVKQVEVKSGDVKVVHDVVRTSSSLHSGMGGRKKAKRKHGAITIDNRSMEEMLADVELAQKERGRKQSNRTLAVLLNQGLVSEDKKILNVVLAQSHDKPLIHNTLSKLPTQLVLPLCDELTRRMDTQPENAELSVKWLLVLLEMHTAFIMTFPDVVERLSGLHHLIAARLQMLSKIGRLKGKVDLLLAQISQREEEKEFSTMDALKVYDESSSSEEERDEEIVTELLPRHSDSEPEVWQHGEDEDAMDAKTNHSSDDESDDSIDNGSDDGSDNENDDDNGDDETGSSNDDASSTSGEEEKENDVSEEASDTD